MNFYYRFKKQKSYIAVFIILLFTFILFLFTNKNLLLSKKNAISQVKDGIITITQNDLMTYKVINLKGTWEFYTNALLTPGSFDKNSIEKQYIKVPSIWNESFKNNDLNNGYGYGTYHMKIEGLQGFSENMALKIDAIYSAYNIWINGENVYSAGTVDINNNTSHGEYKKDLLIFNNSEESIDILIQVSNFEFNNGGIWKPIFFGELVEVQKHREISIMYTALLLGAFIFMGIYHVYLSYYIDNSKVILSYGLFCLIIGFRLLIMGDSMIFNIINSISYNLQQKIEFITFYLGTATLLTYVYYRYPSYIKKWVYLFLVNICGAFTVFTTLVNLTLFIRTVQVFQLFALIISGFILYIYISAALNKEAGAKATLIGMFLFNITIVIDIFYYWELTDFGGGKFYTIGMFVFLTIQSIVLADMFSGALYTNKMLAKENHEMVLDIVEMNRDLEEKIEERTQELNLLVEKLNIQSTTDEMTGILNRSAGIRILEKNLALAKRKKTTLSLCFIDINDLKFVNDTMGHRVGDRLIKTSSNIILSSIRESDTLFRMGGDEFIIIFPETKKTDASIVIDKIYEKVEEENNSNKYDFTISLSYGFSEFNNMVSMSVKKMIELADVEMYKDKTRRKRLQEKLSRAGQ